MRPTPFRRALALQNGCPRKGNIAMKFSRITVCALPLALMIVACQSEAPKAPLGEQVAKVAASSATTEATGVISWELYQDAEQTTLVGVDAAHTVVFEQHSENTIVDGHKTVTVRIVKPSVRSFRILETGERVDLVISSDPRLESFGQRMSIDVRDFSATHDEELGACTDCAFDGYECVASGYECTGCGIHNPEACLACANTVRACYNAYHSCKCCLGYGSTC